MELHERVARDAAAEATGLIRAAWETRKHVQHKGEVDLVTDTDRAVEDAIVRRIRGAFPDHGIVAEEAQAGNSLSPPDPDRLAWYVDPIDGTTNFAHAYPQVAVSIALCQGTDPIFGLVHDPIRGETFHAHRGRGAWLDDRPIRVSETRDLDAALIATGFPYDRRRFLATYLAFFGDFVGAAQGVRRTGAAALDLCYVACGRLDGFWEWKLQPWDTAAGTLIVQEAGGSTSDFGGARCDLFGAQTVASNGRIHAAMVTLLSARLAATGPPR